MGDPTQFLQHPVKHKHYLITHNKYTKKKKIEKNQSHSHGIRMLGYVILKSQHLLHSKQNPLP